MSTYKCENPECGNVFRSVHPFICPKCKGDEFRSLKESFTFQKFTLYLFWLIFIGGSILLIVNYINDNGESLKNKDLVISSINIDKNESLKRIKILKKNETKLVAAHKNETNKLTSEITKLVHELNMCKSWSSNFNPFNSTQSNVFKNGWKLIGDGALSSTMASEQFKIFNRQLTPFPSYYKVGKHQYLIKAEELKAVGCSAGDISSIALSTTNTNTHQFNLTIKMGNTNLKSIGTFLNGSNLRIVYDAELSCNTDDFSIINFGNNFYWDGVNNIVIQFCYANNEFYNGSDTKDWLVHYDAYDYNTTSFYYSDGGDCMSPSNGAIKMRPRFGLLFD